MQGEAMRTIEMVKKIGDNLLFSIDDIGFRYNEGSKKQIIKYQLEIDLTDQQPIDIRFWFQEIDSEFEFLLPAPGELTDYIKNYEENNNPNDECLFHDFRTKYIEFIRNRMDDRTEIQEQIIIIGYSLRPEKVYLVIKTFSLKGLSAFWKKVQNYCLQKEIQIKTEEDIRWVELQQYMLEDNSEKDNRNYKDFLDRTLVEDNFKRFRKIFQCIDIEGYFSKKVYDETTCYKRTINGKTKEIPISPVRKYITPYWKYNIRTSNKEKTILCLHHEMPDDKKIDEYVYTFHPDLMRYYLQNWFEDFTVEIIKRLEGTPYHMKYILPGRKYNFFLDEDEENIREIDVALGVEKAGCLKLIAIECKKTLSRKELQTTNKKSKEKIVNSGNNVFDAFIHIGCFKNDVEFDKKMKGTRKMYKQDILESENSYSDVPYYAFAIESVEDYKFKFQYILDDIFKNW